MSLLIPVVLLEIPGYSLIDPLAPPDSSNCLLEDSVVPMEKPGLDVKKGFDDFNK